MFGLAFGTPISHLFSPPKRGERESTMSLRDQVILWVTQNSEVLWMVLGILALVLLALQMIKAWRAHMRATANVFALPRTVMTTSTSPTPVNVGFQPGHFFWSAAIFVLLIVLWFVPDLPRRFQNFLASLGTARTVSAATPSGPTMEEKARQALAHLAEVARRAEKYSAHPERIEAGTDPFFLRLPWDRVLGRHKSLWSRATKETLARLEPGVVLPPDGIISITAIGNREGTAIGSGVTYCRIGVPDPAATGGYRQEGRIVPFVTSPGFLDDARETIEWASEISDPMDAILASRVIVSGGGGGYWNSISPLPSKPQPNPVTQTLLPTAQ